jgi:polysaccharide export outer membrane protein
MSGGFKRLIALAPVLLAGCSTLSGGGPSASTMRKAPEVEVVNVTPELAEAASQSAASVRRAALNQALEALRGPAVHPEYRFAPGDVFDVTVWSYSALPGGNTFAASSPAPMPLGSVTLAEDGGAPLPYAGRVMLAGLTLDQGQQAIARRYAALRILQGPAVSVKLASSPKSDVLVTGAVGHPLQIPWSPAGLSLAQAVTQALGDGNATLGQGDLSATRAAVRVTVERDGAAPVELPVAAAFEQRIPLQPGDRIVVRKAPVVEVTMLGSGTKRNGVIGFAKQPVLAEALAEAGGLDNNVANDHAVFVLRKRDGARPILYDFAWKQANALVSAQQFPLESGDVVYVAEAPIVSVQKVIGLLFQVTLPAQVLK